MLDRTDCLLCEVVPLARRNWCVSSDGGEVGICGDLVGSGGGGGVLGCCYLCLLVADWEHDLASFSGLCVLRCGVRQRFTK